MPKIGGRVRRSVRRKVECRRMSDKETIRFVRLYRDNECLWNNSHVHYKLKDQRIEAYRKLMVEMDMESVEEVKRKLKSIRDTYTSERNRMLKSNFSYRTKLVWYPIVDEFISKCGSANGKEIFEMADSLIVDQRNGEESNQAVPVEVPVPSSPEISLELPVAAKRKRKHKCSERIQPTTQRRQDLSDLSPLQHPDVRDEYYYFGLSIASQLRSMAQLDALILQDSLQRVMSAKRIEIARRQLAAESSDAEEIVIENPQTFSAYNLAPNSSMDYYFSDDEVE